jgi:hypothetical protein
MRAGRAALLALLPLALAHGHHAAEDIDPQVPIDWIMYTHMAVQTFVWAILFPIGMVLGLSKSRFHVPLQAVGVAATLVGSWLGHHHGGREFPATVHGTMAKILFWVMMVQTGCGIFLKLHILEKTVRPWINRVHGPVGMAFPILGWTQILMGVVTALGFCRGGEINQCLAHYIMGSAFIGYAVILVIMLNLGGAWLARRGCSQEMLDSSVFLSRKGKRSFVPGIIITITGWGMSAHEQELMISSKVSVSWYPSHPRSTACSGMRSSSRASCASSRCALCSTTRRRPRRPCASSSTSPPTSSSWAASRSCPPRTRR